jgi:ABC-type branched-subunit amino acid transport system substrate-binding protein
MSDAALKVAGCTRAQFTVAVRGVIGISQGNVARTDTQREQGGLLPSEWKVAHRERMKAKLGKIPVGWGDPHSYDAVWVWALALDKMMKQHGATEASLSFDASREDDGSTRKQLVALLRATSFWGATGLVTIDPKTQDRLSGEMLVKQWNASRGELLSDGKTRSGAEQIVSIYNGGAVSIAKLIVNVDGSHITWPHTDAVGDAEAPTGYLPDPAPQVVTVKPISIFPGGGAIEIRGRNFRKRGFTVTIGGILCRDTRVLSSKVATCWVPPGYGPGKQVIVRDNFFSSQEEVRISYTASSVTRVTIPGRPFVRSSPWAVGGTVIQVSGAFFTNSSQLTCRIGDGLSGGIPSYGVAKWITNNDMTCTVDQLSAYTASSGLEQLFVSNDGGIRYSSDIMYTESMQWFNKSLSPPTGKKSAKNDLAIIRVGLLIAISENAWRVDEIMENFHASVADINKARIFPFNTVVGEVRDSRGTAGPTVAGVRELTKLPNMMGIIGPVYSTVAPNMLRATYNLSEGSGVPIAVVGMSAQASPLADTNVFPNFVRVNPSNTNYGSAIASLMHALNWRRVAIMTTDDSYAADLGEQVDQQLATRHPNGDVFRGRLKDDPLSFNNTVERALEVAKVIKNRGLRIIFVAASYPRSIDAMLAALEMVGCTGAGYAFVGDGSSIFQVEAPGNFGNPKLRAGFLSITEYLKGTDETVGANTYDAVQVRSV